MAYIYETEFNTLDLVSRPNWFYDDGSPVTDEDLKKEGYFPVVDAYPHEIDYRIWLVEILPKEEWIKRDDAYHKMYKTQRRDLVEIDQECRFAAHDKLDRDREVVLRNGFEWAFQGDKKELVQCGSSDIAALTPVHAAAKDMLENGESGMIPIRVKSNRVYKVPAEEAVNLTKHAFAFGQEHYAKTWYLKDQVDVLLDAMLASEKTPEQALQEVDSLIGGA